MGIAIEVSISGVESALAAQAGGADRVELCENLLEGGTTPSFGTVELVRRHLDIEVNVIVRPRGGDFCYSAAEFAVMRRDVQVAKDLGLQGAVFGILSPDGNVDRRRIQELVALARPMHVTFHRAFDMACDPITALSDLVELGVERVLTSGHGPSALDGLPVLAELVRRAGSRIQVMAAGGIKAGNVARVLAGSGVVAVHTGSACAEIVDSAMEYRNLQIAMGSAGQDSEYRIRRTSERRVREFVQAVRSYEDLWQPADSR
jgi:copper homeostasis protein